MTKGPLKHGKYGSYTFLKIEAFNIQPSVVLHEFALDFSGHQSTDMLSMDVGPPRNEITFGTFAKLGSCAAVGAATFKSGFFEVSADVRFMVNGLKS